MQNIIGMIIQMLKNCVYTFFFLVAMLYLGQDKILYMPSRDMQHTPADAGLFYKDIAVTAEDGVVTRGWFISSGEKHTEITYPKSETPLLVFMHENAGNLAQRIPYYHFLI